MPVEAETVWRLIADKPLPLHCWAGDCVAYNPIFGNTHFLDLVTGEVLKAIVTAPMPANALCRHVAGFLEVADDGRLAEHVGEILKVLDELGLIEPLRKC